MIPPTSWTQVWMWMNWSRGRLSLDPLTFRYSFESHEGGMDQAGNLPLVLLLLSLRVSPTDTTQSSLNQHDSFQNDFVTHRYIKPTVGLPSDTFKLNYLYFVIKTISFSMEFAVWFDFWLSICVYHFSSCPTHENGLIFLDSYFG